MRLYRKVKKNNLTYLSAPIVWNLLAVPSAASMPAITEASRTSAKTGSA
jgi:hypothetical protein